MWIFLPILLSGVISYFSLEGILSVSGISIDGISNASIVTMLKGILFNTALFFLLINISLMLLKGITPISIFREDNNILRKTNKKVFLIAIFMIPILLVVYSVFCGEIENIGGIVIVISGILIFLGMIASVIKILAKLKFKNYELMYSIKSIKNSFSYFVLVVLSLTMTLWVMLIGFNLENAIKENYNEALDNSLPYNYYIKSEDESETKKILKSSLEVEGVIRYSAIEGIIKNQDFNDYFRMIEINEVDEKDYGIDFRVIEGENLFEGEEGVLISDVLQSKSGVKVNDILEIETSKERIEKRVKGIYKSGGVNTLSILKENVEWGDGAEFLVKATSGKFIDNIKNSSVIAVDDLGEKMAVYVSGFLKLFRIVSIICFLGTILFNINIVYINCSKDERDEEILLSLGCGKEFILRGHIIKIIISMSLAVILSLGIYSAIVKLFFAMMFNGRGEISVEIVFINIILGLIISVISFRYPFKKIVKKKELELLRID
ncbi:MAG: FtsX-like permease family protein [Sarcina sp.]